MFTSTQERAAHYDREKAEKEHRAAVERYEAARQAKKAQAKKDHAAAIAARQEADARRVEAMRTHPIAKAPEFEALRLLNSSIQKADATLRAGRTAASIRQELEGRAAKVNELQALAEIGEADEKEVDAMRRAIDADRLAMETSLDDVRKAQIQLPRLKRQRTDAWKRACDAIKQSVEADVQAIADLVPRILELNERIIETEEAGAFAMRGGSLAYHSPRGRRLGASVERQLRAWLKEQEEISTKLASQGD